MDFQHLKRFIEDRWAMSVLPTLTEYIAIPCVSPAFEPDWGMKGHMAEACKLLADWTRKHLATIDRSSVEIHELPGRTPLLCVDIPGTVADDAPVILYGHLDKQPAMDGWIAGRAAWTPTLEGDRLYGRGGADDGYALFSIVLALLALDNQNLPRPRCVLIIEASEESSSEDLPFYFEYLAAKLGSPKLVVALDAMCGNYDQLWVTTSLRGQVAGTLTVRVLDEAIHSGEASGIVPSSFRIATHLLARIEDPATGRIVAPAFIVDVPEARQDEAHKAADVLGQSAYGAMPFIAGARPASDNIATLLTERSWRAQLAVTGADGLPAINEAASVMLPATSLKLSLRLPPTLDADMAGRAMKRLLEDRPPYGCHVLFDIAFVSPGWCAPGTHEWLETALDDASCQAFGRPSVRYGGGGGIPFLNMLGDRFPRAQFLVTGVLGPQSNAHGPNEFLHVPTAIKVTAALSVIILAAASERSERLAPSRDLTTVSHNRSKA